MSALENAHEEVAAKLVCAEETIVREGVSKAIGEILLGGAEAEPAEDGAEDKAGEEDGDDDMLPQVMPEYSDNGSDEDQEEI